MAYSGTTNQTKINVDQLISYAFRDAGKTAEEMTPEYVNAARQALFYILQNMSNRGVNLWLLENYLLGPLANQQWVSLPDGTIDVREANWVYVTNYAASGYLPTSNVNAPVAFDGNLDGHVTTSASPNNYLGVSYGSAQRVFYVGFNAYVAGGGTSTYNLAYETSEDGVTWTTQFTLPATTLSDREWAYFPINITGPHYYYRLRDTTGATFSVRQIVFSTSQQVIPLARLNRDDYWNLPNKQFPSNRSLQYWYDRTIDPSMYLWPVPNNDFQLLQLIIEKQMPDVGSLTDELYLPDRWIGAVQALLSHKLSIQLPGVDLARVQYLEAIAKQAEYDAAQEERDKSPIYFQPNISYYTR